MADQDNLDLGPETPFDSEYTRLPLDFGDWDEVYVDLEPWDIDSDFGYDLYTGGPAVDEWGYGPEYYRDEFDY